MSTENVTNLSESIAWLSCMYTPVRFQIRESVKQMTCLKSFLIHHRSYSFWASWSSKASEWQYWLHKAVNPIRISLQHPINYYFFIFTHFLRQYSILVSLMALLTGIASQSLSLYRRNTTTVLQKIWGLLNLGFFHMTSFEGLLMRTSFVTKPKVKSELIRKEYFLLGLWLSAIICEIVDQFDARRLDSVCVIFSHGHLTEICSVTSMTK